MHLVLDGNSAGPFTPEQVRAMWAEGKINGQTLFFRKGMTEWQPLSQIQHEFGAPSVPTPAMTAQPTGFAPVLLPGFWRRVGGIVVDLIVLGVTGWILGIVLFDTFVAMGQWGRLVGFTIAGAYFGVLDSSIGGGATLGKRILGMKVVGADGASISLGRSLLRYVVWAVPYFLNNVHIGSLVSYATITVGLIFAIGIVSIVYLLIFNRRTHQNIHDLATSTYVVRDGSAVPSTVGPVWKGHFVTIGVIIILLGCMSAGGYALLRYMNYEKMLALQEKVMALPDIQFAGVNVGTSYSYVNGQSAVVHSVSVVADYTHPVPNIQKAAQSVAAVVLVDPASSQADVISITVQRAWNIGIASGSWNQVISHRPEEWQKELDSAGK